MVLGAGCRSSQRELRVVFSAALLVNSCGLWRCLIAKLPSIHPGFCLKLRHRASRCRRRSGNSRLVARRRSLSDRGRYAGRRRCRATRGHGVGGGVVQAQVEGGARRRRRWGRHRGPFFCFSPFLFLFSRLLALAAAALFHFLWCSPCLDASLHGAEGHATGLER